MPGMRAVVANDTRIVAVVERATRAARGGGRGEQTPPPPPTRTPHTFPLPRTRWPLQQRHLFADREEDAVGGRAVEVREELVDDLRAARDLRPLIPARAVVPLAQHQDLVRVIPVTEGLLRGRRGGEVGSRPRATEEERTRRRRRRRTTSPPLSPRAAGPARTEETKPRALIASACNCFKSENTARSRPGITRRSVSTRTLIAATTRKDVPVPHARPPPTRRKRRKRRRRER